MNYKQEILLFWIVGCLMRIQRKGICGRYPGATLMDRRWYTSMKSIKHVAAELYSGHKNRETYMEILRKLKTIASSDSYVRDMEINALLSQLLVLLMEDSWNPEDDTVKGKRVQVMDVREYIDSNYATDITLDGLSAQFFINKTYLSEMFKEQYGVNLKDYLVSVRITEAKKLLRFTDKTTEEIATMVGINGAAYFSRMFKRVESVTPTEYRAMW